MTKAAAAYFTIQTLAIAAWWIWAAVNPDAALAFQPAETPQWWMTAFWIADVALVIAPSALAAAAYATRRPWATIPAVVAQTALGYGTLYFLGVAIQTGQLWAATAVFFLWVAAGVALIRFATPRQSRA